MASPQLTAAQIAEAAREAADAERAAALEARLEGWHAFSSRDGQMRIGARTGSPRQPADDDDIWAATVIGNDWDDLTQQLAEQAQHDAERSYAEAKA